MTHIVASLVVMDFCSKTLAQQLFQFRYSTRHQNFSTEITVSRLFPYPTYASKIQVRFKYN